MRIFLFILFVNSFTLCSFSQTVINGTWQGVIIRAGQSIDKGTLIYAEFKMDGKKVSGTMREEIFETSNFAVKKISGTADKNSISFRQIVLEKSSKTTRSKWCRLAGNLTYDSVSGYLKGKFESTDCRRVMGEIILYRSDFILSKEENPETSHLWFSRFCRDYKEGLSAPEIRKIERDNFIFEPVFFDHDQSEIRPEHFDFLNRMIKVVKGHTDLRVKVTGHTDSEGSDEYNDGLSKRRAESIIQYFINQDLSRDRLDFDFKGEKLPIDTNDTPEGKQRNRRVDFEFI